ncbi:phosphatidylcholine transfer protein [Pimephales promelas]|nr:phosphatidylcholine transfer protein [Pimephales promelas]
MLDMDLMRLHDGIRLADGVRIEFRRGSELHEKDYSGQKAIYWEVKYPLPLSNRDYVYVRERRDLDAGGRKIWVVLAKSSCVSQCAEKRGVIRVKDYKQSLAMESDGSGGTKVFMNYFDNPGGMIPTWLVNWAAKTGVPAFLTDMKKACANYANYCTNNK